MGGVRRVAHRIASDPLPAQGRPDHDRTLARHRKRRERHFVRLALVVEHAERMRDRGRRLRLAEVEHEENDRAAPRLDRAIGRGRRLAPKAETPDHPLERGPTKGRRCLPRLRLDRIKNVSGFGVVDDLHLVDEARRSVLHDRRGLGEKRHRKLRRMRIGGERGHCDDEQHKGEQSRRGHGHSS